MTAEEVARHADACALQPTLFQRDAVVNQLAAARLRGRVAGVGARHRVQHQRGVGHAARHRASGVLRVGHRDDATAADQSQGRLDAHQAAGRCRRDDGAIGAGADRQRGQASRDGGARAGTRAAAAGVAAAVQRIHVVGQAVARVRRAGWVQRIGVGPLSHVGLADDDGAGRAQAFGHMGVARGARAGRRRRTGCGTHPVGRGDIVFQ